jgi:hypothetical protein
MLKIPADNERIKKSYIVAHYNYTENRRGFTEVHGENFFSLCTSVILISVNCV